jgi:aryl-alcohol dehydrogenase-like predicted oxidoreductase
MQEAENSLRRLKTDYIDLYQVHRPSATTDVEETLGALTDLVRQGKVRYIGSSSYQARGPWNNSSHSSHRCTSPWTPRSWIASMSW